MCFISFLGEKCQSCSKEGRVLQLFLQLSRHGSFTKVLLSLDFFVPYNMVSSLTELLIEVFG